MGWDFKKKPLPSGVLILCRTAIGEEKKTPVWLIDERVRVLKHISAIFSSVIKKIFVNW